MKILVPILTCASSFLLASERFSVSLDGLYLKFYSSHDDSRWSVYENNATTPEVFAIGLHNTPISPTWGLQGSLAYKGDYCDLFTRLSGFYFDHDYHPRTRMYPGIGYENNYTLAESGDFYHNTDLKFTPTAGVEYLGDNSSFDTGNGVMISQSSHDKFISADLTTAPEYNLSKYFTIRPLLGLGGLYTQFQTRYIKYTQQGTAGLPGTSAELLVETNYKLGQSFKAIGPETGLDIIFYMTPRFWVDTNATMRWLFGYKQADNYKAFLFNNQGDTVDNQGTLRRNGYVCQADYIFNAKLCLSLPREKDKGDFVVTLGYKLELLPKFFSAPVTSEDSPDEGIDFMLQGLTIGALYKF